MEDLAAILSDPMILPDPAHQDKLGEFANCFSFQSMEQSLTLISNDYIRQMTEVQESMRIKRAWKAHYSGLQTKLIDTEAALLKTNFERTRNFDRNYALSERYQQLQKSAKVADESYRVVSQRLRADLDRIDLRRMTEFEKIVEAEYQNISKAEETVREALSRFVS